MVLAEEIWSIPRALTPDECRAHIFASERAGYAAAPLGYSFNGPNGFAVSRNGRNCGRAAFDGEDTAACIWERLAEHLPSVWRGRRVVGLNERLRFYRYTAGERLGLHRDGFYRRPDGANSLWTLMIYLNEDFTGGATRFAREEIAVTPQTGLALIFPHHFWHEGCPVIDGCKYVIRTDVMFAPE